MTGYSRTIRRRWTALVAVAAVLFASDARLTHFTSCADASALSVARSACPGEGSCCPSDAGPAESESGDLALDACGCCTQAPPGHGGERDARSALIPGPVKVDPEHAAAPLPVMIAPPTSAQPALATIARPDALTPLALLSNRLRF